MNTENTASKAFEFWSRPIVLGGFFVVMGLIQFAASWGASDQTSMTGKLLLGGACIACGVGIIVNQVQTRWARMFRYLSIILMAASVWFSFQPKGPLIQWSITGGIVIFAVVVGLLIQLRAKREAARNSQTH